MSGGHHKVVLISGASSGIGLACAGHLARRGYRVFGTSRGTQHAGEVPFEMIQMDVDDEASVRSGVDLILKKAGRLDVVVNNAGFGIAGSVEDTSIEEARAQFETNFFGVLRICRAVLPTMRAQGSGLIVNVGSIGGLIGLPYQGLYSAAKFALEGLTEALRIEVRPFGVHVVMLEPGDTRTGFTGRRRKAAAAQGQSVYAEGFRRALAVIESDEGNGVSPMVSARVLERIITSRSPRLHYRAGAFAQVLIALLKPVLPARLCQWIIASHYHVR